MRPIFLIPFLGIMTCLYGCIWVDSAEEPDFLPLDDSEYPYADLPRVVIETENFAQIRDKETEIPAKMQIWGKNAPESDVMNLTVRGRGNSSFNMPKFGFKLELEKKAAILGMPKDKDWILVANFRDKTQIKNTISFLLAKKLGAKHSIRSQYVEVFLNREYMGLFLITESIKVDKNRIKIPDNDFLIEKTTTTSDHPYFISEKNNLFEIRYPSPQNITSAKIGSLKEKINAFEKKLYSNQFNGNYLDSILDVNSFIIYYWVQEFSRNLDGKFQRSVFIECTHNGFMRMGPVWDFDLSYGIGMVGVTTKPSGWEIKKSGWFKYLWQNEIFSKKAVDFWEENKGVFAKMPEYADSISLFIQKAVLNDNKRWPVLQTDDNLYHEVKFEDYTEAIDSLKEWMNQRLNWISHNI